MLILTKWYRIRYPCGIPYLWVRSYKYIDDPTGRLRRRRCLAQKTGEEKVVRSADRGCAAQMLFRHGWE